MKDVSGVGVGVGDVGGVTLLNVNGKRSYSSSLLEEVTISRRTSTALDASATALLGDPTTALWGTTPATPTLGSMPSLLTPWISSHVTAFDDLKLWGRKRLKTAHTVAQVRAPLPWQPSVYQWIQNLLRMRCA